MRIKILLFLLILANPCFADSGDIHGALVATDVTATGTVYQSNTYISTQRLCQQQVTTNSSTQQTAFSIPVPQNKNMIIKIRMLAYQSDYSKSNSGEVLGVFVRGTGNVSRDGTLIKNTSGALSGAGIDMIANTSTQSVDIKISGTSATVVWNFAIDLIFNT